MYKKLSTIFVLIVSMNFYAQQIELQKIDDFMIAQAYNQRDNIIIDNGYLYALSNYGLEIYEIGENAELYVLTRFPICKPNSFVKFSHYIYLSSGNNTTINTWGKVCQINIIDPQNPIIENEIEYSNFSWPIVIYGDYLNVRLYDTNGIANLFYSLPNLTLVSECQNFLNLIEKFSDEIALRLNGSNQFTVFDLSDPVNIEIIGNGDVSSIHQYGISRVASYNDTILICSNTMLISFWDVSDWNNWEYLSQYNPNANLFNDFNPLIIDNQMVLAEFGFVELVDLSDICIPIQTAILSGTADMFGSAYIADHNDYLFLTTNVNGIQIIKLMDDNLVLEYEYADYYFATKSMQKNDFLITAHSQNSYQFYDYANPINPINNGELIPQSNPNFENNGNRLAVFQEDTFDFDIYNISNLFDPEISNHIDCDFYNICRFDQTDQNSVYFVDTNFNLRKFDISVPGINDLTISEILNINVYDCIIYNGFGYFLELTGTNTKKLYIYGGLDLNQPVLINVIENFVNNSYARLKIVDDMLVIYSLFINDLSVNNRTKFFDLESPGEPIMKFELAYGGEPYTWNDLIFVATSYLCFVFQKNENTTGLIEPFYSFYDISNINSIFFVENIETNYLLLCQASHLGVFSFNYTSAGATEICITELCNITNYPNPFNPSTTISFELTAKDAKNAKLEIYNIKGQKVKTLLDCKTAPGKYNCVWNGKDENGKRVSSGQYTARLTINGEEKAVRKIMLVK